MTPHDDNDASGAVGCAVLVLLIALTLAAAVTLYLAVLR